jgi:hypothetical protein
MNIASQVSERTHSIRCAIASAFSVCACYPLISCHKQREAHDLRQEPLKMWWTFWACFHFLLNKYVWAETVRTANICEYRFLEYDAVWSGRIAPTFRGNILPLSSVYLFDLFFDHEDGGDMLLRNVGWLSMDYTSQKMILFTVIDVRMSNTFTRPFFYLICLRWLKQLRHFVGVEVLTAVVMKSIIFWDITPYLPLSTLFSNILSPCSSLNVRDQVSQSIQNHRQNYSFTYSNFYVFRRQKR